MLKTVVLLNIFVENPDFLSELFDEYNVQKNNYLKWKSFVHF